MAAYRVFLKIILFVALFNGARSKLSYILGFTDRVGFCKNFDNDVVQAALQLAKSSDGETDSMSLTGSIDCLQEFGSGYMVGIDIAKETDVGSEPLWSCAMDLCGAIEDEDSPWASMMEEANITACPIAEAKYPVQNLMVDSSFAKDYLNKEFVGDYDVEFSVSDDKNTKVACHTVSVSIKEVEEDDEDC